MEKRCSKCGVVKDFSEFSNHKNKADGKHSECKVCARIREKEWTENHRCLRWAIDTLGNHRKRGYKLQVTPKEVEAFVLSDPTCYLCGKPLEFKSMGRGPKPDTPTLDRVDNSDTLKIDNIMLCCHECNTLKGPRNLEELDLYMIKLLERRGYKVSKCQ